MDPWQEEVGLTKVTAILQAAAAQGLTCSDQEPALIFHDLDLMRARLAELRHRFPSSTLHTLAIKANPLVELLRRAVMEQIGLEAASLEEVHLALAAGCPAERIVFDSPAKTEPELQTALALGVHINVDNVAELQRLAHLRANMSSSSVVGLRVNPLVGAGTVSYTSVASHDSKFGITLDEAWESAPSLFRDCPWLTALHVHVGSQGCSLTQLALGVGRILQLRNHIQGVLRRDQVQVIDIGGGLPATYEAHAPAPSLKDYVAELRREAPQLYHTEPGFSLITEFGRAVQAGCGWAVSRVEYLKQQSHRRLAVIHLGADFLMRPVYQPQMWRHRFALLHPDGTIKEGTRSKWSIAGPLCFAGDMVAKDLDLPDPAVGDLLLIRDVGAYTLGLWSRHCSRAIPQVLGYEQGNPPRLTVLRKRESASDLVRFWSP